MANGTHLLVLVHLIWKERNHRIFNGEELADQRLKESSINSLFDWSKASLNMGNFSLLAFTIALAMNSLVLMLIFCRYLFVFFVLFFEYTSCILRVYPLLLALFQ